MKPLTFVILLCSVVSGPVRASSPVAFTSQTLDLFSNFSPIWRDAWQERKFAKRETTFTFSHPENEPPQLKVESSNAASGLYRELANLSPKGARLSWRWGLTSALDNSLGERTRAGDDYAARVWVVFESSWIPLRTRAICYVWAAHEAEGVSYPSPWSSAICTIVVRSGKTQLSQWLDESRDLEADYRAFFHEAPRRLDAIGIMADTDNTGRSATAHFSQLHLLASPAP